jgi:hypothetical protein
MASVRCPGCGAKNPEDVLKCRICGYDLRGNSELPMSQPKAGSEVMKSGSLKGVFALAVLAVLGIVLAGVLLGILPGGDVLTNIRNKIPAIATKSSDGWEDFVQADARFSANMPVDRTESQVPFQWSTTGTIDQWVSTLGPDANPDTTLSVQWAPVPTPEGENPTASMTSLSIAWAESLGGTVATTEETSFQGYPAVLVSVTGLRDANGDVVTARALFVRRREQQFVIVSNSVYKDHPQFSRLVNGFTLL